MRASMRSIRGSCKSSSPLLPPSFGVKIIAAMTVAAIVLRFLTTGPVGHKDG
jgi:hypothetical protein